METGQGRGELDFEYHQEIHQEMERIRTRGCRGLHRDSKSWSELLLLTGRFQ